MPVASRLKLNACKLRNLRGQRKTPSRFARALPSEPERPIFLISCSANWLP